MKGTAWKSVAGMAVLALSTLGPTAFGDKADKAVEKPKDIDVVICLDVSNSMDGLIGSVKKKLWDIVNDLARAKPMPNLRVGLFSYGNDTYDPKVGWVRKDLDLTHDLDKVSEKLFGLKTLGGTEYVARVCRDAIEQLQWSEDPGALKLIFVCGNEPVDQDKEVHLKDVAEKAVRKGIIINTIYAVRPRYRQEAKGWKDFALMAEGRFAEIDQDRGTVTIATPQDKDLARLSGELNTTYVFYGKEGKEKEANQKKQDANAATAGAPIAAARAVSKSSGVYRQADADLVDKLKADRTFDVKRVPADE
ncbi:MAG TPA: vWA domain-containing protein, partial [Gemmataceae bacterium]|nr:vWA domain-containing protein [Gemmataceae bacterium]